MTAGYRIALTEPQLLALEAYHGIEVALERYTPSAKRLEGIFAGLEGPGGLVLRVLMFLKSLVHPGHSLLYLHPAM